MLKFFAGAALALSLLAASAWAQTASDAERTRARAIYERIVAMDTSVEGRQNPAMAAFLAEQLRAGGFPAEDIHVIPHDGTAALVARYRGDGSGGRAILFLAHMDVVPARREDWERDPFTLIEEGGFFFGRGAQDNKAGIALLTATFIQLRSEGFRPTRDLILVFTGDEETSGAGARLLLQQHRALVDAEFALNSDAGQGTLAEENAAPTAYNLQTAEKSYASYSFTARNPGGHSSQPRPDNAIYDLMEAVQRVRAHEFPVEWNDTTIASMRAAGAVTPGELGAAMRRFAQRPGDRRAAAALSRDPAYVGQVRTTCVATMLQAGHAENALPQSAVATVNCRIFPGTSVAAVRDELQRLAGNKVSVAPLADYWSSEASPLRDDVLQAVRRAVHANYPGVPITPGMSVGATDAVFFRSAGIPTYGVAELFIKDSDDYAHGLNERMPVASFYNGLAHWRILITELAGRRRP
ncbi:MAG: M20/M25/M40 family metallo-hydrolase [Hyphomonadaceae bacterium]|nr:M20/M25/M40 family metallo-hydrolase [Hyphomonadaceae bacterium]